MEVDDFNGSPSSESLIAKKLKQNEDPLTNDVEVSASMVVTVHSMNYLKNNTSGSNNSVNHAGSNSVLSFPYCDVNEVDNFGDDAGDFEYETDDISDYGDNGGYMYDDDDDYYSKLQAQFDNVDLPPGVEASVPWLQNAAASDILAASDHASTTTVGVASSSKAAAESISHGKCEEQMDDVLRKLMYFKQFDTVEDFSDHHYKNSPSSRQQPSKSWTKKIQDEWKILEQNLPETIFVRVYESRMDLLRAVIIGPAGTPYHDGLFVFDAMFPARYPDEPPMVYYYSGGLRLNPNLYECGKVCLSLLNTWRGNKMEMWLPEKSTMLQVLVSIQALILNAKPFFNEPGYESSYTGVEGERKSKQYNREIFLLSMKTMVYTLRRPPKHFEDLVRGHFRIHSDDILSACKAYIEGAEVGSSSINNQVQSSNRAEQSGFEGFKASVTKMMKMLITNFTNNGSKDCEKYLPGAAEQNQN
ncbi:hypothetical protein Ancab_007800 [Ancistrocladus abbreviatus]